MPAASSTSCSSFITRTGRPASRKNSRKSSAAPRPSSRAAFNYRIQVQGMTMSQAQGTIVQCIGAVVDIEFPRDSMPRIYDALTLGETDSKFVEKGLTFEVEQQLGDGVVRTIALGSSDGLQRGMKVASTGKPISVPVGAATLGRVMDVLGRP